MGKPIHAVCVCVCVCVSVCFAVCMRVCAFVLVCTHVFVQALFDWSTAMKAKQEADAQSAGPTAPTQSNDVWNAVKSTSFPFDRVSTVHRPSGKNFCCVGLKWCLSRSFKHAGENLLLLINGCRSTPDGRFFDGPDFRLLAPSLLFLCWAGGREKSNNQQWKTHASSRARFIIQSGCVGW